MKHYFSSSPVCFIDRDISHYPVKARVRKAAVAVAYVFGLAEDDPRTGMIVDCLSGDTMELVSKWFTPSQAQAIAGLSFWLGGEAMRPLDETGFNPEYLPDLSNRERAFLVSDLNTGRVIVFVSLKLRSKRDPLLFGMTTEGEQS